MFFFIRRSIFTIHTTLNLKRSLYLTLVRSNLSYCSQVWHRQLIKDIKSLEQVRMRVTWYIISDQTIDYKSRLASLATLPFKYFYKLQDLLFLIKFLLDPNDDTNIRSFLRFSSSSCSSRFGKLSYNLCHTSIYGHFYLNVIVRLYHMVPKGMINLSLLYNTIKICNFFFWKHFTSHYHSDNPCSFHTVCPFPSCCHTFIKKYGSTS